MTSILHPPVRQPVLLLSHGASILTADPRSHLHRALVALGQTLQAQPPRAVLIVSAHFIEPGWTLTASPRPTTIHDHPVLALRDWTYDVPGAPELAEQAAGLLDGEGSPVRLDTQRGLDHGAWLVAAPLLPAALQIPVVQLSLRSDLDPASHLRAGRALRRLRDEGVLVITSGGMTHNQQEFRQGYLGGGEPDSAAVGSRRFDEWLRVHLTHTSGSERSEALAGFAAHPDAAWAHPSPEHLLPLFVGLGVAEHGVATSAWAGFQFGLSTAAYRLD